MPEPEASLVIAFYNNLEYLRLVLAGAERQSFNNFEVIIADDGSLPECAEEIEKLSKKLSFPLKHIWHDDKGWRKNKILNQAILAAASNYLIFIDGDCVPHSEFIREHFENREKGVCLTGRRVNLSKKFTKQLTPEKVRSGFLDHGIFGLILDGLFGKSFDVEKGFYFKSDCFRNYFNKKSRGLLGCNFSVHKNELIEINGFDERYLAPSIGEDSDVQFRYELNGGKVKSLNNIAVQYHLYHKIQPRPEVNKMLFEQVKNEGESFTKYGIVQDQNLK